MDHRRRAPPGRPVSSEELDCWSRAAESLKMLNSLCANANQAETINRVNRLISAWPSDDLVPAEGINGLRNTQVKLTAGYNDISNNSAAEIKVIDETQERLGVLLALLRAPETKAPLEKRNKRPRASSPAGSVAGGSGGAGTRSMSITLPARTNSVGPTGHGRDSRSKKDAVPKAGPLQPGRKVVFRPPNTPDADESTWMMAIVTRYLGSDKQGGRYEVQDAEPQDDGQPGALYIANLKSILPLPDPDAAPGTAAHISSYPEFPVGSTVMALYPDTSCFYRAEVIDFDKPKHLPGNYKVKFEDDEDMVHSVSPFYVVDFPARLS